jgi:hypothetical protein
MTRTCKRHMGKNAAAEWQAKSCVN